MKATTHRMMGGPADGGLVELPSSECPFRLEVPLRTQVPSFTGWPSWVPMPVGMVKEAVMVSLYAWSKSNQRYYYAGASKAA